MISMKKVNYAAIDIGSNAVRLLIKCVNEENAPELMSKVQLIRIPLRLLPWELFLLKKKRN